MSLRLVERNKGPVKVVEIHGDLLAAGISELNCVCETQGELVIDLANLRHVDPAAAARLRELSMGRAKLTGASRYIAMILEGEQG
jgi:hypothetical protein